MLVHIRARANAPACLEENTMSDQPGPFAETPIDRPTPRRGSRRWLFVATVALAAALTGAAATRAIGQRYSYGGPGFMAGPFDPAQVEDRADRGVRHLAIEIDASTEQQEKLRTIVKGAIKDLLPMRAQAVSARERGRVLVTQPTIDRSALAALRTEQMAVADAASKRFAQAIGDAADVLNPEQRRKIDERLTELREHR